MKLAEFLETIKLVTFLIGWRAIRFGEFDTNANFWQKWFHYF